MKAAFLPDRGVVKVSGDDARDFLNGLVTADVDTARARQARASGAADAAGQDHRRFHHHRGAGRPRRRLLARLPARAGAEPRRQAQFLQAARQGDGRGPVRQRSACWRCGTASRHDESGLAFRRSAAAGARLRVILPPAISRPKRGRSRRRRWSMPTAYEAHRIALGVPRGGLDFIYGDAFPHETNMDRLHGVDFDKGCYVGQEVVSRMQHRGTARTRVVPVTLDGFAPDAGTAGDRRRQAGRHHGLDRRRPAASRCSGSIASPTRSTAGTPLTAGGVAVRIAQARLGDVRLAGRARRSHEPISAPARRRHSRAARGPAKTRSTSPITTTNGACRNMTTARSTKNSMLDGFQAGLSWITILRKRDNFRKPSTTSSRKRSRATARRKSRR